MCSKRRISSATLLIDSLVGNIAVFIQPAGNFSISYLGFNIGCELRFAWVT